ncbi:glycosyltransferase family 4 protein [Mesorhizobium sp. CAU 1741]|uniref:glycosyltransferase family 4 protein n=1 Tax=Mesorhizobium sp. CAU 1741 TaxID=3140366 RepID=UPI00325C2085
MTASRGSRPPRILFVQTQAEMAGAQEISRLLGNELASAAGGGFEVHHLFLYRKTAGCDGFPNVQFVARERPRGPFDAMRFIGRLFAIIRRLRPDVVLTFQHYGNIVAAPAARLVGVPRIIANHVSAPATISGPVRFIDRLVGLAGFYDVITVNSQATRRDYQAYPSRYTRRIVHVPHGFSQRTSSLAKQDARARFGLPRDVPLMGTVARLHPLKRIDLAVATLTHLPTAHLAIAGQGPDLERLRSIAREHGVAERVHFAGEMDADAVGDFLAGLDLFVFPSEAETFGLAAVEAAQAGVPVVAQDLPVLREVLDVDGEPCAVFVDASDTPAFAKAISQVMEDACIAEHLSTLGRRLSERYSVGAMVDAYRALIVGEEDR